MEHKCDKCGAEVCQHCGKACGETCADAKIEKLERAVKELEAAIAQPTWVVPFQYPVYIPPPVYYPPWKYRDLTITCETAPVSVTPTDGQTMWISQ